MPSDKNNEISFTSEIRVRFTETDPLGIVWHGNYIQYFEDGREAFGREHGISYLEQKANGYTSPIVKSTCEHKLPLRYGDVATIKTTFVPSRAAKMIFKYKIYNPEGKEVCVGETIQVFLNEDGKLSLTMPEFFAKWREKMGV
ncbi:acyl-CoA thioesterase [Aequorivita sp. 609]|uniref:Acyl-CoA thioesterase n=1 Tax=Aequorivita xiaoshiensis TaxID=2874476 RepID=A0A9X1QZB5_9FLAO|nr:MULTISPECIES: acyl-CoA thioesterase [Aequorivita]MBB6679923.1 acyl-CoA thioesterase [Aequorivita sp. 609]MCG2430638.1 acyl-CoA thioesterase [Aequorivita xiaoshiensis]